MAGPAADPEVAYPQVVGAQAEDPDTVGPLVARPLATNLEAVDTVVVVVVAVDLEVMSQEVVGLEVVSLGVMGLGVTGQKVVVGLEVVSRKVTGLEVVGQEMGQKVASPEVVSLGMTDQEGVGLEEVSLRVKGLGVMGRAAVDPEAVDPEVVGLKVVDPEAPAGVEALAAVLLWEGAQIFFGGLSCASEPQSESHHPWSAIVVLVGRRNKGRTAPLLARLVRPGRCPASSKPVSGTDTMPSYENPTFTAVTMLPSKSNASLSDMAPASGGNGSRGELVWGVGRCTAT